MGSSGVRWMGEIPKGWNVIRFKFMHGPANVGCSIDKNYWSNDAEDIPFYTAGIQHIYTNNKKFPIEKYTRQNDLLLSRNGTPYVYLPVEGAAYTDHIIRVGISPLYDRRFVRYCLQQSIALSVVDTVSLPTWSVSIWNRQYLPLVSLTEQHAIADYLDERCAKIDAVIAESKKSIEEYKELKQAVISNAILCGLNKGIEKICTQQEWLKYIPSDWKLLRGKFLFEETNERSMTGREELLTVSQYTGITPRSEKNVNMFQSTSLIDYKICHIGDIAANTMWMWAGAVGVSEYYGVISPSYNTYRQTRRAYNDRYLDYLLRTPEIVREYASLSTGIRASRLRLYPKQFLNIRFPVPPMNEQIKIVSYLDARVHDIDSLISEKQSLVNDLEAYKKSLIYEVVTGKRRIN